MELLASPQRKLLIEEPVDHLHQQSGLWLNLIDFWHDELRFLTDLVTRRLFEFVTKSERIEVSLALEAITGAEIEQLRWQVTRHENALAKALAGDPAIVKTYRDEHRRLMFLVNSVEKRFKGLRALVIDFGALVNRHFFNANETIHTIFERRSVRRYTDEPIPHFQIQQILEAAAAAPSGFNLQPWKFYVLSEPAGIARLSQWVAARAEEAIPGLSGATGDVSDPVFYGAPAVVFITDTCADEWSSIDIGMCAQNLVLAAKSYGLDTCLVGLTRLVPHSELCSRLGIPAGEKLQISVVLGKAAECPVGTEKKAPAIRYLV